MTSTLKTAALLGLLSAVFLYLGQLFGGEGGLMIAFLFAVVMNVGSYWFSDKIVLRMYRAQEVGPSHPLHQLTAELVKRAQLPMPKVYVIPDQSPNAFATGRSPKMAVVAVTTGILKYMPSEELEGVIADAIEEIYLQPERPRMSDLMRAINARCHAAGLSSPDRRTVKRRVALID